MTDADFNEALKIAKAWRRKETLIAVAPEALEYTLDLLANVIFRLDEENRNLRTYNEVLGGMINDKIEDIKRLETELSALREKSRWRDENVEPAPRGERVLVYCIDYDASDGVHDTEMEHMYCPDGELAYPYTWWRPLDLPGEAEPNAE